MELRTPRRWLRTAGIGTVAAGLLLLASSPFRATVGAQTAAPAAVAAPVIKDYTKDSLAKRRGYDGLNLLLLQHDVRMPEGPWSDADDSPTIDLRTNPENGALERTEFGASETEPALTQEIPAYLEGSTVPLRVRVYNRMGATQFSPTDADVTVTSTTDTGVTNHCNLATTRLPSETFVEYVCNLTDVRATGLNTPVDVISTINVSGTSVGGAQVFQGTDPASINVLRTDGSIVTEVRQVGTNAWFPADTPADAPQIASGRDAEFRMIVTNTGEVEWKDAVVRTAEGCEVTIGSLKRGGVVTVTKDGVSVVGDDAAAAALQGVVPTNCVDTAPTVDRTRTGTVSFVGVLGNQQTPVLTRTNPASYKVAALPNPTIRIFTNVRQSGTNDAWLPADTADAATEIANGTRPEYQIAVSNGPRDLTNVAVTTNDGTCQLVIGALKAGATVTYTKDGIVVTGDDAAAARLAGTTAPATCLVTTPGAAGSLTATVRENGGDPQASNPAFYRVRSAEPIRSVAILTKVRQAGTQNAFDDADTPATATQIANGSQPEYQIIVTNNGNTELANVTVTTNDGTCQLVIGALRAGAVVTYTKDGIAVTGDDAAAARLAGTTAPASCLVTTPGATGSLNATVSATNTPQAANPANYAVRPAEPTRSVSILTKVRQAGTQNAFDDADTPATATQIANGSQPEYQIIVTNTGTADLADVTVTTSDGTCQLVIGALRAGAVVTYTRAQVVVIGDDAAAARLSGSAPANCLVTTPGATGSLNATVTATNTPQASNPANYAVRSVDPVRAVGIRTNVRQVGTTTWFPADTPESAPRSPPAASRSTRWSS